MILSGSKQLFFTPTVCVFCSSDGQSMSKVHFESSGLGINDLMIVLFVLMYCTAPVAHCVIGKMGVKCDLKA